MIRYAHTTDQIKQRIARRYPKWLAKADERTRQINKAGAYVGAPTWSKIKPIFMEAQAGKCAYCERELESGEEGKIEWDVEHYRPKSEVQEWPPPDSDLSYPFSLGPASRRGYHLLAFHIGNYLASCKVCNSVYKRTYFPIASGKRVFDSNASEKLKAERPYIPYPIGDDNPEEILMFKGFVCFPAANDEAVRKRARVTIDFFELNVRDTLLRQRARVIISAWLALEKLRIDASDAVAEAEVQELESPATPHANCARSFIRTYRSDRALAKEYAELAAAYFRKPTKKL
jgi:hypothetical protein